MPKRGSKPRRRKDGLWEVRVYVEEGERLVRRSFYGKTAKEAKAKSEDFLAKFRMGLIPRRDPRTFAEFAEAWLERKARVRGASTIRAYRREVSCLLPHLGTKRLQDVRPQDVRHALDALAREGLSQRTLRKVLERARAIFKEALALELVVRDPTAGVRVEVPSRPPVGRALEPHEAEALLAAFDAWPTWEVGMALRLCLALGLRVGEALGLTWGDVDLEPAPSPSAGPGRPWGARASSPSPKPLAPGGPSPSPGPPSSACGLATGSSSRGPLPGGPSRNLGFPRGQRPPPAPQPPHPWPRPEEDHYSPGHPAPPGARPPAHLRLLPPGPGGSGGARLRAHGPRQPEHHLRHLPAPFGPRAGGLGGRPRGPDSAPQGQGVGLFSYGGKAWG